MEDGLVAIRARGDRFYALVAGNALAALAWARGDLDTARALFADAVFDTRGLRDKRTLANALYLCAEVAADASDAATARAYYAQALNTARELGGVARGEKLVWAVVIAAVARTRVEVRPRALRVATAALHSTLGGPVVPLEDAITTALEESDAADGQTPLV
jgi:hypothetical protein